MGPSLVRLKEKLGLLGIFAIALTYGFSAHAETLSGTVVDPQQRVFAGAEVSLTCRSHTDTHKTDEQGQFTFTRQSFPKSCRIRAGFPSFTALEVPVGQRRM